MLDLRSRALLLRWDGVDILPDCDRQNVYVLFWGKGLRLEQQRSGCAGGQSFVEGYQREVGGLGEGGEVVVCPALRRSFVAI